MSKHDQEMAAGKNLNRRNFFGRTLAALAGLAATSRSVAAGQTPQTAPEKKRIKEFRVLGRTGFKVSDISLGGASLTTASLVKASLETGINYIDTAEGYMQGNSERMCGEGMKGFSRQSIFITSKLFIRPKDTKDTLKDRARQCLERLQTDYLDCLMIHMTPTVELMKHEGFHAAFQELKAEGKIRFCGLSNHGVQYGEEFAGDGMEKVIGAAAEDGRFDVVLFVYNFLQREAGERILEICRGKNMGTTLMKINPVQEYEEWVQWAKDEEKEGRAVPEGARKRIELYKSRVEQCASFKSKYQLETSAQVRDAAVKFVLNHPQVHTVTISLANFSDVEAYAALSGQRLAPAEKAMLGTYESTVGRFYCRHACGACESACPRRVPVNTIMRYNQYFRQGREKYAMLQYASLGVPRDNPCESCPGHCETACPYRVPIQGLLLDARDRLTLV